MFLPFSLLDAVNGHRTTRHYPGLDFMRGVPDVPLRFVAVLSQCPISLSATSLIPSFQRGTRQMTPSMTCLVLCVTGDS